MRRAKKSGIAFLMLLGAMCSIGAGRHLNRPFADFDARDPISGKDFKLSDFRGKVVLIDFWATWCGPCVRELPNVKQAWNRYKDDGLVIISISLDDNRGKFESFVKSRGMDWHHVMDGGMWNTRLAQKYGITSIPAMFIINHEGVCVADSARGARLSTEIERALNAASAATGSGEPDAATIGESALPELIATRDQFSQAISPIKSLVDRLEAADEQMARLQAELPKPSSPAATRDAFARLRADLQDMRGELFAIGLLNSITIDLPADPFADASLDEQRALLQAHEYIASMRSAVEGMNQAVSRAWSTIDPIRRQLDSSVQSAQNGQPPASDPYALMVQAQSLASRWGDSWKSQLDNVATRNSKLAGSDSSTERLKDIGTRLAALRGSPAPPSSTPVAASTEGSFESICKDLASVSSDLKQAGANVDAIRLPKNPLNQPGTDDRRARAELDLNIRIAGEAVAKLTTIAATAAPTSAKAQPYLDQIKQLNEQVKRAGTDAPGMSDSRAEFESLCSKLLDALDA